MALGAGRRKHGYFRKFDFLKLRAMKTIYAPALPLGTTDLFLMPDGEDIDAEEDLQEDPLEKAGRRPSRT